MKSFIFETSTVVGLGPYSLQGAPGSANPEYGSFISAEGNGGYAFYFARGKTSGRWEANHGVVAAGSPNPTLSRNDPCLESFDGSTRGTSLIDWDVSDGVIEVYAGTLPYVLNNVLTMHRGATEPPYKFPGMVWFDTSAGVTAVVWKYRTAANTWITLATINETSGGFLPAGGPYVPIAGGVTITGAITHQSDLTLQKASPKMIIDATSGDAVLDFRKAGVLASRLGYSVPLDAIFMQAFNTTTGALVGTPFTIDRATGAMALQSTLVVPGGLYVPSGSKNIINSSGNLQIAAFNGGSGASADTAWLGNGTWGSVGALRLAGAATGSSVATITAAINGVYNYLLILVRVLPSSNSITMTVRTFTNSLTVLADYTVASVGNNSINGGLRFTGWVHQPNAGIRGSIIGQHSFWDGANAFQSAAQGIGGSTNGNVENVQVFASGGNVSGDIVVLGRP